MDACSKCGGSFSLGAKNGLRIMNQWVDRIINDLRPFKMRCNYCGKTSNKDFECPNCGSKALNYFKHFWKGN